MTDTPAFTSFAPGFEFLQGLVKNAGAAVPGMGQWVAPTLDPQELDKRIQELKTVQFWLEQNARMLGATIQALEVQKMTLNTLQTMNVQMGDLRDALTIRMPRAAAAPPGVSPATPPEPEAPEDPAAGAPLADAKPAVDPMQWWGALTEQFSALAATAMKDGAAQAAARVAAVVPTSGTAGTAKAPKASFASSADRTPTKKATGRSARPAASGSARGTAQKKAVRAPR